MSVHQAVETVAPEVLTRLVDEDAAEEEERQQVGDGHQRVHAVGQVPDDGEVHDAAHEEGGDVEQAVDDDPAAAA